MRNSDTKIDDLIKESLSKEEAEFYDSLDEQNVFEMIGGLFKTKNRWFIIVVNIIHIISFVVFVYCLIQFFKADDSLELIRWTAAGFLSLTFVGMLKLFGWMQMDKNAVLRELKRVELQVASLSSKFTER